MEECCITYSLEKYVLLPAMIQGFYHSYDIPGTFPIALPALLNTAFHPGRNDAVYVICSMIVA